MSIVSDLLRELSGGENRSTEDTAPGIPSAILARAREAAESQPAPSASPGSFSGAGFQDILLNLADAKWDVGAEQRFAIQGHGLYLARDGSAPDVAIWVNTGRGEVRLSPGTGFRGRFDGFTARLFGKRRNITRHDARLVVELDPASPFLESSQALARFHPVPLMGGDRLLNEAGVALSTGIGAAAGNSIYPQGFSKLLVELKADAGSFGATEAFKFYATTVPLASGVSSQVARLVDDNKSVNANAETLLAFLWTPPKFANDPSEPPKFSGAGSSSARNGIDLVWTASGTCVAAHAWVTGIE